MILGIFVVAFFYRKVGGTAVFRAAILGQSFVTTIFVLSWLEIVDLAFLWLNLIGCVVTVFFAAVLENSDPSPTLTAPESTKP